MATDRFWTGVGSRQTPVPVLHEFRAITARLEPGGWIMRSGGADHADASFEWGVSDPQRKQIIIPHDGFYGGPRREGEPRARRSAAEPGVFLPPPEHVERAMSMARAVHPNWEAVMRQARTGNNFAMLAHTRNTFQVLGLDLATPSEFVVLWAPVAGDSITGGTRTALEIARRNNIPVYNFAVPEQRADFYTFLDTIAPQNAPATAEALASPSTAAPTPPPVANRAPSAGVAIPSSDPSTTGTTASAPPANAAELPLVTVGAMPRSRAYSSSDGVYVGRTWRGVAGSPLGNPYHVGRDGPVGVAARKFWDDFDSVLDGNPIPNSRLADQRPALVAEMNRIVLRAIDGGGVAVLCHGCKPCHGDGVARTANAMIRGERPDLLLDVAREAVARLHNAESPQAQSAAVPAATARAAPTSAAAARERTPAAPTATATATAVLDTAPAIAATATSTMRTNSIMSTTDAQERFQTIRDNDTRYIAREMGRLGGQYANANQEWVFPGSDYISRNLEFKTSTAESDKADALLTLYAFTRPTPEQMAQLEATTKLVPLAKLGINAPRGSVKAKEQLKELLNPNVVSKTRVEFILNQTAAYTEPASEKEVTAVNKLIEKGFDIIAWGFNAQEQPDKVWHYDGAPKDIGKTSGRAKELMKLAQPYVEAEMRRARAIAERGLIAGDLENSKGAINYAGVDVRSDEQLNVLRRIEAEGGVTDKRLGSIDAARAHRAEQDLRAGHNERTQADDTTAVQNTRGFDGVVERTATQRAYERLEFILREHLEATSNFTGNDIVLRQARSSAKITGTLVQYMKVEGPDDQHFLAAVQHAPTRVETPSHYLVHRLGDTAAIGFNVSDGALRDLKAREDVITVVGPVTYAEAQTYAAKHELEITRDAEQKQGVITEKPSRTFTILDSRTFDQRVEAGAPVRLVVGEPVPTNYVALDQQHQYSIVTDREDATVARFAVDALKKVAGPFNLDRALAYADTNQLSLIAKPGQEFGEMPIAVDFAGIGHKTRTEILNLDPVALETAWGFAPFVLEKAADAHEPTRIAINPEQRPGFWTETSTHEVRDLLRKVQDIDPSVAARDTMKQILDSRSISEGKVALAAEIPLPLRESKTVDATVLYRENGFVGLDRGFNRFSIVREADLRGKVPAVGKPMKLQAHADKSGYDVKTARATRSVAS